MNGSTTQAFLVPAWKRGGRGPEVLLVKAGGKTLLGHVSHVSVEPTLAGQAAAHIRSRNAAIRDIISSFGTEDQVSEAIAAIERDLTKNPSELTEKGWELIVLDRPLSHEGDSVRGPRESYGVGNGNVALLLSKTSPTGFDFLTDLAGALPECHSEETLEEIRDVLARTGEAHLLDNPVFLPDVRDSEIS